MATRFVLKKVRLAFGQGVYNKSKPPKSDANAKEKFRCTFLLPKDHPQLAEIRAILKREAQEKFGAKWEAIYKAAAAQDKVCLRDGDLKADYEGFADHMAISANSLTRPTAFDETGNPAAEDSGIIYSGCYVNAIVTFKAYDNVSKGVTAELNGVRKAGDADAFSGGRAAEADEFGDELAAPADEDSLLA